MKVDAITSIDSFSYLRSESLEALSEIAKIKTLEKTQVLYYEGEKLDDAYFLVKGKVEIYKMDNNDNELFLCYVGDTQKGKNLINAFGDFQSYRASASVRSLEMSTILLLDLTSLSSLVASYPDICMALLREFMNKLIVAKTFINFQEIYDSTSKVAYILCTQLDYFNKVQRQVIARELNIKIETLSRILQKMLHQGLIYKDERGEICLSNQDLLEKLYRD